MKNAMGRPRRERALGRGVLGCCALLAVGAIEACGGRAQAGSAPGATIHSEPGFLFDCEQTCDEGLACVDGQCTLTCREDSDCWSFSTFATCSRADREQRRCVVVCGSDDGCAGLGAGSYCGGAFCVADKLEDMPARYDSLAIAHRLQQPSEDSFECDPSILATNVELVRRSRRVTIWACEPQAGGGYVVERKSRVLGDAEIDQVDDAYRGLLLNDDRRCDNSADVYTLTLYPASGTYQMFSDAAHSSCTGVDTQNLTSSVENLDGLYGLLLRLGSGG